MIVSLVGALMALATLPADKPVCLGVFLPRDDRVLRIMWVNVTGEPGARQAFAKAVFEKGYQAADLKIDDSKSEARLTFISPRTTFAMADDIIQRSRKGEFGQLGVDAMVMRAADGEMQKCLAQSERG